MFDTAHVLIFLIMVLFVAMIGLILWRFASFCEDWDGYELTAIEAVKQGCPLPRALSLARSLSPPPPPSLSPPPFSLFTFSLFLSSSLSLSLCLSLSVYIYIYNIYVT
jgi:hypothetical protein